MAKEKEKNIAKYDVKWLRNRVFNGEKFDYFFFWGFIPKCNGNIDLSCLSQMFATDFVVNDVLYNCTEQFFMSTKAHFFNDYETERKIMECNDPREMKRLGRQVKGFDDNKWKPVAYQTVILGNYQKFVQNEPIKKFLLATGDSVLVEASPYDTIWGIGIASTDEMSKDVNKWRGANLLGFALMTVRDMLILENQ